MTTNLTASSHLQGFFIRGYLLIFDLMCLSKTKYIEYRIVLKYRLNNFNHIFPGFSKVINT